MTRRSFFAAGTGLLAMAGAYAFGEEIAAMRTGTGAKTAILYGTRYGATRDTAGWIAEGIGEEVALLDVETMDPSKVAGAFDNFVVGSGIWIDGPHKGLLKLMEEQHDAISGKVIASFVVCGSTDRSEAGRKRIASYLQRLEAPLAEAPKLQKAFGGRMIIAKLTESDRKLLKNFYENIVKKPFVDWDRTEPVKAKNFGEAFRSAIAPLVERTT